MESEGHHDKIVTSVYAQSGIVRSRNTRGDVLCQVQACDYPEDSSSYCALCSKTSSDFTGMHESELPALTPADIDLKHNIIVLPSVQFCALSCPVLVYHYHKLCEVLYQFVPHFFARANKIGPTFLRIWSPTAVIKTWPNPRMKASDG